MNETQLREIISQIMMQLTTQQSAIQKPPAHKIEEIPDIIKSMSADKIRYYFGMDIGNNQENPYKCLQKKFLEDYNIVSDTKYKPRLTLYHKHLIIQQLMKSATKKQQQHIRDICIRYLKKRIENPPATLYGKPATKKQQEYIINSYKEELKRWIGKPTE